MGCPEKHLWGRPPGGNPDQPGQGSGIGNDNDHDEQWLGKQKMIIFTWRMTKGNDASALIFILQYFLLNLFTPNLEEEVDWILELGPAKRKSVLNHQSSIRLFLVIAITLMTNTTWVLWCWKCSQQSQKPQWGGWSVCTQTSSRAPGKGKNSNFSEDSDEF